MRLPFSWRYPIREARRRLPRTLLTLVGIALGVGAVTAASLAERAVRDNYAGIYRPVAGRAALEVVACGGWRMAMPDLGAIESVPGVRAAAPVLLRPSALVTAGGPLPILVVGIDPRRDAAVRDWALAEGSDGGLRLEAGFAARHGLAGRAARFNTEGGPVSLPVEGLLAPTGPARFNRGAVAVLPLPLAQRLFAKPGEVSAVQLVLDPGADPLAVARAVEEQLPDHEVRDPLERGRLGREFLHSTEQMMRTLSAIAVVAGAMVIANTFLMSLGERRRQVGLLRALGATRRQVAGLVARQALLLGVAGTLAGLPLGVGLAALLVAVEETFLGVPMPRWPLAAGPLLMAAALGPAVTLLAALLPAGRAAARPPLAALTARGEAPEAPAVWPVGLGLALVLVVAAYLAGVIYRRVPPSVGLPLMPFMAAIAMVGCATLLSLPLPALLRLAGRVVPAAFGVEGRLAVRHLQRRRARTALTVGVLFAAVTACVAFGLSFLVNLRDIERWYGGTIDGDFLVRAVAPDPGLVVTPAPLPPSVADEVRRLPGCDQASRFCFRPTRIQGVDAQLVAREFPEGRGLPLVLDEGDPSGVRQALRRGEAAVSTALANRLGVGVGGELVVPARGGQRRLRVAGLVKEYTAGGMSFYVDWEQARGWLGDEVSGLMVTALPGEADEFAADLADYCARHGLLLQPNSEFAASIGRVAAGVRWFVVGMAGLVFLVAAVGVVNTLTTNVLDQTRELGVLRALGMRRGQLARWVVAQASALALASCLPGAPMGVLMAFLMNRSTPALIGHVIPFHIDYGFVAACAGGVAALAVLASLLPARRAARLPVIDALRYE
jgi:putative ABC transport system permease protein